MRRSRRRPAALALMATAALISACGSGPSPGAGSAAAANHQKGLKFAQCMRANGVGAFPDPGSGQLTLDGVVNGSSLNPSAPAWKRAISVCHDLEPPGFTGRKRSATQQSAALKFAECIRENGVPDFPDPTANGPLIDTNRIPSAAGRGAQSIPGLRAAAKKCSAIYSGQLGLSRRG